MLVFLAILALVTLLLLSMTASQSQQFRKTLESTLQPPSLYREEGVIDLRKSSVLSTIPWLDERLSRLNPILRLRRLLDQADLKWTPSRLVLSSLVAWAVPAYFIYRRTGLLAISLGLALVSGALPVFYVIMKRRQRFTLFVKKLPDTLDLMVSALRVGHSLFGALSYAAKEAAEPVRRELQLCFEEQNFESTCALRCNI